MTPATVQFLPTDEVWYDWMLLGPGNQLPLAGSAEETR